MHSQIESLEPRALFSVVTGPISNPANGHDYYLVDSQLWTDAEAEAIELGGHLATINDAKENGWVFDTFHEVGFVTRHLWIGLRETEVEGEYECLLGRSGNDILRGRTGRDTLIGGKGVDELIGGRGLDVLFEDEEET